MVSLAISPCPNDTFAFRHLIHTAPAGEFDLLLADVEELNRRAERGEAEVTKVSVAAYGRVRERYLLLHAGGAAGFGVGPLLVARKAGLAGVRRVAIPGARTTAALLLGLLGDFETVEMRFDRVEQAVLDGVVDAGVLIHEGRFTYADRGLVALEDLGEAWQRRFAVPVPLGAIAVRRDLGADFAGALDRRVRASVEHALAHPDAGHDFVARHAREMAPDVIRRHIELYVNDYTLDLDRAAVEALLRFGVERGAFRACDAPLFAGPAGKEE